jgi:hypothetical protein
MGEEILVPPQHWADLKAEDMNKLCDRSLAVESPPNGLILSLLGREILVDRDEACLKSGKAGSWEKVEDPLLELLILVYLLKAGPDSLKKELISVQELKTAHFFQGPHELRLGPLLTRYGQDSGRFKEAAESLGGEALDLADISYSIPALPKVPLYYLLWEGDEEFEPRVSVLFDRSVENHLSADAIWGLVNLVSEALVKAPNFPF